VSCAWRCCIVTTSGEAKTHDLFVFNSSSIRIKVASRAPLERRSSVDGGKKK